MEKQNDDMTLEESLASFGSVIDISDEVTSEPVETSVETFVETEKVSSEEAEYFPKIPAEDNGSIPEKEGNDKKKKVNEKVAPAAVEEPKAISADYFRGSRKKSAATKIKKELKERGYVLAEGEREYTRYNLGGFNEIILTDRRFIALNESMQQVEIEKISGLSTCYKTIVSTGKIVGAIILIILGLVAAAAGFFFLKNPNWLPYVMYAVGAIMLIIGIVLIATSMGKKFFLTIYTDPLTSYMTLKSVSLRQNKTDNFINVAVGKDAFFCANLIGADILTLKNNLRDRK